MNYHFHLLCPQPALNMLQLDLYAVNKSPPERTLSNMTQNALYCFFIETDQYENQKES